MQVWNDDATAVIGPSRNWQVSSACAPISPMTPVPDLALSVRHDHRGCAANSPALNDCACTWNGLPIAPAAMASRMAIASGEKRVEKPIIERTPARRTGVSHRNAVCEVCAAAFAENVLTGRAANHQIVMVGIRRIDHHGSNAGESKRLVGRRGGKRHPMGVGNLPRAIKAARPQTTTTRGTFKGLKRLDVRRRHEAVAKDGEADGVHLEFFVDGRHDRSARGCSRHDAYIARSASMSAARTHAQPTQKLHRGASRFGALDSDLDGDPPVVPNGPQRRHQGGRCLDASRPNRRTKPGHVAPAFGLKPFTWTRRIRLPRTGGQR
jgi:hypothetical protein